MDSDTTDANLNNSKKDRSDNWGSRETEALIGVWKTHYVALESITHKRKIYKLVSERLKDLGHTRDIPSVQAKINKLKTLYRKNKPDPATGNRKPKWRFWDAVHEVVQQPLLRQGIRERIGPGGITRETGPVSPSGADPQDSNADNSNVNATDVSNAANNDTPKEKAKRAKKGPGPQARKKLTIKHEEVLKKLLREEDESQILIQKLNTSYQDTVSNIMLMQKKCSDTLCSLMTVFEGYINANQPPVVPAPQPPPQPPPPQQPTSRPSMNLPQSNSLSYGNPMNSSQHQSQQFSPNRPPNNMPQHFQRPQSHFPQPMPSCRPPSMLYQQQQPPPPMMPPPPMPAPPPAPAPPPPVCFPSWNPLNIRTETLLALLLPNLRTGLNALPAPPPPPASAEQNESSSKENDDTNDNDNENEAEEEEESE